MEQAETLHIVLFDGVAMRGYTTQTNITLPTWLHSKGFWSRSFYEPDQMPFLSPTQPTISKHWRQKYFTTTAD